MLSNCQNSYFIVDYERSNFSISQCLFEEGSQQKLVGIPSVNATATGSGQSSSKAANRGTIVGIAVAAVVLVVVVVSAVVVFCCLRRRRSKQRNKEKEKAAAAKEAEEAEEAAERIRKGFDKAELGDDADHARYEMAGSGPQPAWVLEKADLTDYAGKHELTGGDVTIAELSDRKRLVHEMYDPSAAPVELPADMPQELLASIPSPRPPRSSFFHSARQSPSFRSGPSSPISPSDRPSPIERRMGHTPQSRSSTLKSVPFTPSPTSQSGPSSATDRSMASSHQSPDIFSPISPLGNSSSEGRSPIEQIPLATIPRHSPHSAPSPSSTSGGSQRGQRPLHTSSPGGNSRGSPRDQQSPLISSLRNDDSRRRRRNQF